LIAILLPPAGVLAQYGPPEPPALEFETNVAHSRLELMGRERIRGLAPLQVPGPLQGEFWLNASGPQLEPQRGRVRIGLDSSGSRIVSYSPISFQERLLAGLIFPGYAQIRYREGAKGAFLGTAAAAGLALGLWAQFELWDAKDEVTASTLALTEVGISDDELFARERAVLDAVESEDFATKRRNLFLGATAATWGIGLLDALVFAPDFRVRRANQGSLSLALQRRSKFQAGIRSLVFPGLGHHYYGANRRAFLAALGGIAAVGYVLYEQDDYNDAVAAREQAQLHLDHARTEEEEAVGRIQLNSATDEVDSQDRDRKLAFGVTIGVWGLSLLDALWSNPESPVRSTTLGLVADPRNRSLAAQLRF
jgi:hypothetical protein